MSRALASAVAVFVDWATNGKTIENKDKADKTYKFEHLPDATRMHHRFRSGLQGDTLPNRRTLPSWDCAFASSANNGPRASFLALWWRACWRLRPRIDRNSERLRSCPGHGSEPGLLWSAQIELSTGCDVGSSSGCSCNLRMSPGLVKCGSRLAAVVSQLKLPKKFEKFRIGHFNVPRQVPR